MYNPFHNDCNHQDRIRNKNSNKGLTKNNFFLKIPRMKTDVTHQGS